MYKKLFISTIILTSLYSSSLPYTMYAVSVESVGDIVSADGGVIIYHKNKVYKANRAVYNTKKKVLELFGNVKVITNKSSSITDYLKVNVKDSKSHTNKFFIYDGNSKIWLRGSSYKSKNGIYRVKNSEISSCKVKNPDWKILFAKGKYNKNIEFVTLSRPTFYFKQKPVFALPWFGFSTVKKRKTGLLRPRFGINADSGFIYKQPYFYAPYRNWDIEFTPQIRTNRGIGLYSSLNFADSKFSKGSLTLGYFKEKSSFFKEKNLRNKEHHGLDFYYEGSHFLPSFLKSSDDEDGLYIKFETLNDIDYENLKDVNIKSYNKLVTSRLNSYLKRKSDYFGLYAKYFIDTDKVSNSDTMQELPSFQYHIFTKNIAIKNLTYSFDYKFKNNYRREGLNAAWQEINFPIKFDISLLDDFLNFSFSENLYYSKINYSKLAGKNIDNAVYFSNYHKFVLSSDLTKKYDNFLHNIQLQTTLQVPSFEHKSGDFADFIDINKERKNLNFSINQYFYDKNGFDFLTLRSSQIIYLDKGKKEYGDILNDIYYKYSNKLSISENTSYSKKFSKIKKIQTSINYKDDVYKFRLSHTHKNVPNEKKVNYLTTDFSTNLNAGFKIGGELNYDIKNAFTRDWSLWLYRDKKCWNYKITYKESLIPIATSGGAKAYKNKGIYFLVNFANIGGISYEYAKDNIVDSGVSDE